MSTRNIIPWSYAISIGAFALAIYSKIAHSEDMLILFVIAVIVQFVFAFFAIYELRGSEHFTEKEKSNWTVLLLCAPLVFGAIYLFRLRRRIFFI